MPHIYAEGVTACSPGLQCEASYPGFKSSASSTLKALLQFVSGRQQPLWGSVFVLNDLDPG